MAAAPLLSVLIPIRDVARFVGTLTTTLRTNRRPDIEYVFIDDHSVDETAGIVRRAMSGSTAWRMVDLDETTGLSAGRNAGLAASDAPVVTFLDGDDWIAPGYLDAALDRFEQRDVDVLRVDHTQVTANRREVIRNPIGVRGTAVRARDYVLPVHRPSVIDFPTAWGGFYRRDFLERNALTFDESLLTAEDRDWWWRVVLADGRMSFEDLNGYRYRRGVLNSLTQIGDERQLHYFDSLDRALPVVTADRDAARFLPKLWRGYLSIILSQYRRADRLSPRARRMQRRRSREVLARVPQDLLRNVLVGMAPWDVDVLTDLGLWVPDPGALPLTERLAPQPLVPLRRRVTA